MPLPTQIPLRYTEEDAGFLSVRPVVKQTFQLHELVDMVVSVAGKDPARLQQIFRAGTVVYNGFRYSWDPLPAALDELAPLLAAFPDDDPSLPFSPASATAVLLEIGGGPQRHIVEISKQDASARKLFANHSPWDALLSFAANKSPRYHKYSHARRANLFRLSLPFVQSQQLLSALLAAAPRKLKFRWSTLRPPSALTFVCPRK
ncbi:MAG TPA: hypothetical protein VJX70_14115 [Candidatus Acidoferrum sp.]|nr:hypothetical protein [Candidatus Acidoferrum sp.]